MLVACDKCKKEFEIVPKEEVIYVGIEGVCRVYMVCPNCKKGYTISFRSSKTKHLQNILEKLYKEDISPVRDVRIDETKEQIKQEVERLRALYEKQRIRKCFKS